jgi:3-oxoacyl-[acyl-carrier protein] reductase
VSIALITGTSRGIGKATAETFAENGWDVIAHARAKTAEFENFTQSLSERTGTSVSPIYFDMLDTASMKACIIQLKKEKIKINALVNNAGISAGGLFQMTPVKSIKDVFDVNLFSHMELTQLVLKIMAEENASITNVASIAGMNIRPGNSAYGVSKAALIAWTQVLQAELRGKVRVNAVAPGLTQTDMANEMEEKLSAITLSRSVIERLSAPREVAEAIYFLASDKASSITGEILKVDGGGGI